MHRYSKLTPLNVLLVIRNKKVIDLDSLCEELGFHPRSITGEYGEGYTLQHFLSKLRDAGLINYRESERHHLEIDGNIEISPSWKKIQSALSISLTELAKAEVKIEHTPDVTVKPLFGSPKPPSLNSDVFVLMPFTESLKPVYQDHIVKVVQSLDLKVARADDFFTTHSIVTDIWNAICASRLIIADCTYRNPNVFYEIGLAHTVGKKVILITQNKDDVPFDLRHLRFIPYEYTPPGMTQFENRLNETIKNEVLHIF